MSFEKIATKSVITISPDATIKDAARMMRECHVGDLVVVKNKDVPIGILTDRDIVVSTTAFGVAPESVTVGDTIVSPIVTAKTSDQLDSVLNLMKEHAIKRIPLVNSEGALAGIVTADDITTYVANQLSEISKIVPKQRSVEIKRRPKY